MCDKTNLQSGSLRSGVSVSCTKRLAALGLGASVMLAASSAQALNFDFSFTGTSPTGTVTGEIDGLSIGTGSASSVTVDSTTNGGLRVPMLFGTNVGPNSFTVSNLGAITAGNFYGFDTIGDKLLIDFPGPFAPFKVNALYISSSANGDVVGFSSDITYTPAPVPELPIPLMLSAGMLVPALARRARKRRLA